MKKLLLSTFLFVISTSFALGAIADNVVRQRVAGIDVLVDKTGVKDVVIVQGTWPAGDAYCPPSNPAIATLVAGMLDKGTTKRDKFAIAKQLEELGASIQFGASDSLDANFSAACLREDLPVVMDILAEMLRMPAFSDEEFAKYKKQLSAGIRRQTENTGAVAERAFVRAAYPAGHINRLATFDEWQQGIDAATIADLRAFHATHYGTAQMVIVAAGDVDAQGFHALLEKNFSGWPGGTPAKPAGSISGAARGDVALDQTVQVPGKTSVNIVIGQASGLRYTDPDSLPLRLGTAILGSGFTSRLTKQVREKEGLTYGIGAGLGNDTFGDGEWKITATFAPSLLNRGITSARGVANDFLSGNITEQELAARKTAFVGSQQVQLATTSGLASSLMTTAKRGLPVSWLDEFPAKVEAVTLDQVNHAIKKHLSADKLVLIKAGTISQ